MSAADQIRARQPVGVDISDYSDEFCAGFLAGQLNALDALEAEHADKVWLSRDEAGWLRQVCEDNEDVLSLLDERMRP